jgi:hypothetical protein
MKSYSPKGRVANIAGIIYPEAQIEVRGSRVSGNNSHNYVTEVVVNGTILAAGSHRDWRKAYKSLEIEFSKRWVR